MTRLTRFAVVTGVVAVVLLLSSCPSPFNILTGNSNADSELSSDGDESLVYKTTAEVTFDAQRGIVVFVEEDGTETPVVVSVDGEEDGPVELIDYSILDDGGAAASRFSQKSNRIRAIVVGRRRDGRSGVWVLYRYGGVKVLPNEDGDQDSALMELVEFEGSPCLGDEWVYEATAIKDGKIIIGKLNRPDGWEYIGDSAPDPTIGVFWSIYETDEKFIVSRARPILLMHEPEPEGPASRHSGRRYRSEWLDMLMEWLQATFLELSWNYLGTAERFVPDAEVVKGKFDLPPEGTYVIEGVDKHGTTAWAWVTYKSVENIVDAPDAPPIENNPPNPPILPPTEYTGYQLYFVYTDEMKTLNLDFGNPADPDPGDTVTLEIVSFDMVDLEGNVTGDIQPELLPLNPRITNYSDYGILNVDGLVDQFNYSGVSVGVSVRAVDSHGALSDPVMVVLYLRGT